MQENLTELQKQLSLALWSIELNQAMQAAEKAILQAEGQTPDAVLDEVQAQFSP